MSTDQMVLGLVTVTLLGEVHNAKYRKVKFMRWHYLELILILDSNYVTSVLKNFVLTAVKPVL
jgi:hypothetical protein